MSFITRENGAMLSCRDAGSGPPLVFVHGWGMSGRVWRFQEEALSGSFRVISVDLRGHGGSKLLPGDGMTMADLAGDVAALFCRLDFSNATLIGWSLGAQVALEACRLIQDRLSALVLVGGTPRFTSGDGFESGRDPQEVRGMALRLKRDTSRTMGDFFRGMFREGELSHEQNQRIVREIIIPSPQPDTAVLLRALETLAESDQRDILPAVRVPTLLIHGSGDSTCLPAASAFMARRIPDADCIVMDGCGHAPFLSRPDEFNNLLTAFLKRVYGRD